MKKLFLLALLLGLIFGCVSSEKATTTEKTDMTADDKAETAAAAEVQRRAIPGFVAAKAAKAPVIDGVIGKDEWKDGNMYPLGFNQLSLSDQRPPKDQNDLSGDWTVVFNGKTLYGMVTRKDDATFLDAENVWENDCVEVFLDQKGKFVQLRTLIGEDFAGAEFAGSQKAVWSADGKVLEYSVDMPEANLEGTVCGWALALADNDGSGRDYQLYPITGQNDSWQGVNLGTLVFGKASGSAEAARVVVPFKAKAAAGDIAVDGSYSNDEWKAAVKYPFLFNQLNTKDERFNKDFKDLYGEWGVAYKGNMLYGYVLRQDDKTVGSAGDVWENDSVEVFLDSEGNFAQLRTLIGKKFDSDKYKGTAVWSADGSVLEFSFDFGKPCASLGIIGFNIALADNDGGSTREFQLYPVFGVNDCWQGKNLAELEFVK
ncbi:MAG: hypothetical protein JW881_13140 [Spirochaetales bacterium]|nr:hypothetical protein [Spirochaetales bacterium]